MHLTKITLATISLAMVASAQAPLPTDASWQIRYASNLTAGDSVVNITNNNTRNLPVSVPTTTYGARLIK